MTARVEVLGNRTIGHEETLTQEFGAPAYDRVEAPATPEHKARLERLSPEQVQLTDLAGDTIQAILTHAPEAVDTFRSIVNLCQALY